MRNYRQLSAHRVAYELAKGPIPTGKSICHTCDTPLCCNPAHLWAGTAQDNSRDCAAKGRSGTCRSHLTQTDVDAIRATLAGAPTWAGGYGKTYRQLASQYLVSYSAIYNIHVRKTWAIPRKSNSPSYTLRESGLAGVEVRAQPEAAE